MQILPFTGNQHCKFFPLIGKQIQENHLILTKLFGKLETNKLKGVLILSRWLTHELAQEIVNKMMEDIPYSINIMDEKGIIIGSGNKNRIGTLHKGAVKALESGAIVEIYKDNHYEKKGTNEPIVIGDQFIGVVGITGEPDEVRPFCKLVKTTVSLLIEQSILIGNREAARNREAAFLEALLNEKKEYSQELIEEAKHYQINLHRDTTVLLIKNLEETKERTTLLKSFPFFKKQNDNVSILMLQNPKETERLTEGILHTDKHCVITAGMHLANVAESYRQAALCLKVAENLDLPERFYDYKSIHFLAELSQITLPSPEAKKQNLTDILLQTLKAYINHNGNPTDTAQALIIHRNTLYYRLERIKQVTGKDPSNITDLFELTYLLLQQ
jgi:carbohydrate diacid regulator